MSRLNARVGLPNPARSPHSAIAISLSLSETSAEPYLQYMELENPRKAESENNHFFQLLSQTIEHFTAERAPLSTSAPSISAGPRALRSYLELLHNSGQPYLSGMTQGDIEDTFFLMLGLLTAMKSHFVSLRGGPRQIIQAYKLSQQLKNKIPVPDPLEQTLGQLIEQSGLILSPSAQSGTSQVPTSPASASDANNWFPVDLIESLSIRSTALNASKLQTLSGVRIHWTANLSRHLLLSAHAGTHYLELFALPCLLDSPGSQAKLARVGIPSAYTAEICESYANLFNPSAQSPAHRWLGRLVGLQRWCWCLSCSSRRLRDRQVKLLRGRKRHGGLPYQIPSDPVLEKYMRGLAPGWDQTTFRHLWPRIVALEAHLQNAKPWNFWVLFRDRREKLPFWTFLFGTVILILTAIQVALGIAQVTAAF